MKTFQQSLKESSDTNLAKEIDRIANDIVESVFDRHDQEIEWGFGKIRNLDDKFEKEYSINVDGKNIQIHFNFFVNRRGISGGPSKILPSKAYRLYLKHIGGRTDRIIKLDYATTFLFARYAKKEEMQEEVKDLILSIISEKSKNKPSSN